MSIDMPKTKSGLMLRHRIDEGAFGGAHVSIALDKKESITGPIL